MLGYPSGDVEVVVQGEMPANGLTALYTQNGVLRAALMVNDDAKMDPLRDLITTAPLPSDARGSLRMRRLFSPR